MQGSEIGPSPTSDDVRVESATPHSGHRRATHYAGTQIKLSNVFSRAGARTRLVKLVRALRRTAPILHFKVDDVDWDK